MYDADIDINMTDLDWGPDDIPCDLLLGEEKEWYVIMDAYERWVPQFAHHDPDVLKGMVEDDELFPIKEDVMITRCKVLKNGVVDLFGDEDDSVRACATNERGEDGNPTGRVLWTDCYGNDIPEWMTLKEFFKNNGVSNQ